VELPKRKDGIYVFGPFRLDPLQRMLVRDGVPVELTPRLLDALLVLVENSDRLVQRSELERAIWGDRLVDASSLGKAIASLRKALHVDDPASNFIVTAPGRGYRLGEFWLCSSLDRTGTSSRGRHLRAAVISAGSTVKRCAAPPPRPA
jgi:DNA-binding winged helix-turn-helix (wHTH) protein